MSAPQEDHGATQDDRGSQDESDRYHLSDDAPASYHDRFWSPMVRSPRILRNDEEGTSLDELTSETLTRSHDPWGRDVTLDDTPVDSNLPSRDRGPQASDSEQPRFSAPPNGTSDSNERVVKFNGEDNVARYGLLDADEGYVEKYQMDQIGQDPCILLEETIVPLSKAKQRFPGNKPPKSKEPNLPEKRQRIEYDFSSLQMLWGAPKPHKLVGIPQSPIPSPIAGTINTLSQQEQIIDLLGVLPQEVQASWWIAYWLYHYGESDVYINRLVAEIGAGRIPSTAHHGYNTDILWRPLRLQEDIEVDVGNTFWSPKVKGISGSQVPYWDPHEGNNLSLDTRFQPVFALQGIDLPAVKDFKKTRAPRAKMWDGIPGHTFRLPPYRYHEQMTEVDMKYHPMAIDIRRVPVVGAVRSTEDEFQTFHRGYSVVPSYDKASKTLDWIAVADEMDPWGVPGGRDTSRTWAAERAKDREGRYHYFIVNTTDPHERTIVVNGTDIPHGCVAGPLPDFAFISVDGHVAFWHGIGGSKYDLTEALARGSRARADNGDDSDDESWRGPFRAQKSNRLVRKYKYHGRLFGYDRPDNIPPPPQPLPGLEEATLASKADKPDPLYSDYKDVFGRTVTPKKMEKLREELRNDLEGPRVQRVQFDTSLNEIFEYEKYLKPGDSAALYKKIARETKVLLKQPAGDIMPPGLAEKLTQAFTEHIKSGRPTPRGLERKPRPQTPHPTGKPTEKDDRPLRLAPPVLDKEKPRAPTPFPSPTPVEEEEDSTPQSPALDKDKNSTGSPEEDSVPISVTEKELSSLLEEPFQSPTKRLPSPVESPSPRQSISPEAERSSQTSNTSPESKKKTPSPKELPKMPRVPGRTSIKPDDLPYHPADATGRPRRKRSGSRRSSAVSQSQSRKRSAQAALEGESTSAAGNETAREVTTTTTSLEGRPRKKRNTKRVKQSAPTTRGAAIAEKFSGAMETIRNWSGFSPSGKPAATKRKADAVEETDETTEKRRRSSRSRSLRSNMPSEASGTTTRSKSKSNAE